MALLTVEELKARITTSLSDPTLQGMLDATEIEINGVVGSPRDRSERIAGGHRLVMVGARPSAILDVIEYGSATTILDPSDYELEPGSNVIRRLSDGANPAHRFHGTVEVRYTNVDLALRKEIQAELIGLDIGSGSGAAGALTSTEERLGEWTERQAFASTGARSAAQLRTDILGRLHPATLVFWTGQGRNSRASAVTGS